MLIWMASGSALMAQSAKTIPPSGRWVTDAGDFLDPGEESLLERKLSGYADTTSTQIILVTVNNLGGYSDYDYALTIGREWKVGQAGKDNGVVILISREERAIRIVTGYGMEGSIPDVFASRIIREVITPAFRSGAFYQGINGAIDLLIAAASGEFSAEELSQKKDFQLNPAVIYVIFILIYFLVTAIRNKGGGNSGNRHVHNNIPMILWGSGLGRHSGGGFGGGGFGGGGFGGGGFGGGGGGFGGGGAGGSW